MKFSESNDESETAKKIADKLDIDHTIVHIENFLEELPKQIGIVKSPFWDLHWFHIARKAKTLSDCFIAGDGGDELFGGYTFRYEKFLSLTNDSTPVSYTHLTLPTILLV